MPKTSAERVAEYRARKAGTPVPDISAGFAAAAAEIDLKEERMSAALHPDPVLVKELADLERRVVGARRAALPASRGSDGEIVGSREENADRAEAYARWRYRSWKDGKTATAW